MTTVFLTSDTHFGHAGVCRFLNPDGSKLRPWNDYNEMDEAMVKLWNETVRPKDHVYHLGDVVINRRALPILERLNGIKVLIKGNHDVFRLEEYAKHFVDIRAYHVMDNRILCHIPIHPSQFERYDGNIHGHLHYYTMDDPRYLNVCMEHTGFKPISFEEAMERMK